MTGGGYMLIQTHLTRLAQALERLTGCAEISKIVCRANWTGRTLKRRWICEAFGMVCAAYQPMHVPNVTSNNQLECERFARKLIQVAGNLKQGRVANRYWESVVRRGRLLEVFRAYLRALQLVSGGRDIQRVVYLIDHTLNNAITQTCSLFGGLLISQPEFLIMLGKRLRYVQADQQAARLRDLAMLLATQSSPPDEVTFRRLMRKCGLRLPAKKPLRRSA